MSSDTRYSYPVRLSRQRGGGLLVRFPDVPEALTEGATREEALEAARDALLAALAGYVHERRPLPRPSPGRQLVHLPPLEAAKLALYDTMREQGVSNVELADRLGISEGAVRRLIDPDHRSRIDKVEQALECLGRRLVVSVEAA